MVGSSHGRACDGRSLIFFFFNDTATTDIYTLSLHDALPISIVDPGQPFAHEYLYWVGCAGSFDDRDRKSTRLNSSHITSSYAVFSLKKKNKYDALPLAKGHCRRRCSSRLPSGRNVRSRRAAMLVRLPKRSPYLFFFNDTATTEIYTLSLHDALPIYRVIRQHQPDAVACDLNIWHPQRSRSEEHTSELQSHHDLVCRLLLEKKKN